VLGKEDAREEELSRNLRKRTIANWINHGKGGF
jgi:hypothetical protein